MGNEQALMIFPQLSSNGHFQLLLKFLLKFLTDLLNQGGGLSKSTSFNGGVVVQIFILNRNSTMYYLGGLLSKNWNFEKVPGTI